MKRQWRIGLAVAIGMAVYASMSQAEMSILDDFSADSSGKYVPVRTYGSGTATYARNGANQFEPTWAGAATYVWYWNEGQKLRVGESVRAAFQLTAPSGNYPGAGLTLGMNTTSEVCSFFVVLQGSSGYWGADYDSGYFGGIGTQTGMSTITVTRVSPTFFAWSVRGGGLTVNNGYTNASLADVEELYFGIMGHRNGNGPAGVYDDLSYGTLTPLRVTHLHVGKTNPTNESPAWSFIGDRSPTLEGGTEGTGSGTYDYWRIADNQSSNGYVAYRAVGSDDPAYAYAYYGRNWVIEFKARVLQSTTSINNVMVSVQDGLSAWLLGFRTDVTEGLYYYAPGWAETLIKAMDVHSDYHTYKMAMRQGPTDAEDKVDVYIDGVLVTNLTRTQVAPFNLFQVIWGDGWDSGQFDARFNYVKFESEPPPPSGTVIVIR
jgi:hypothetical protein